MNPLADDGAPGHPLRMDAADAVRAEAEPHVIATKASCTAQDIHLSCTFPDCRCVTLPKGMYAALTALRAAGWSLVRAP